jgi:hypothetical protein
MPTPIEDLTHALKLMRPLYHLRHMTLNEEVERNCRSWVEKHSTSLAL